MDEVEAKERELHDWLMDPMRVDQAMGWIADIQLIKPRHCYDVKALDFLERALRGAVGEEWCTRHDDFREPWRDLANECRTAHLSSWLEALALVDLAYQDWRAKRPNPLWKLRLVLMRSGWERAQWLAAPKPKAQAVMDERTRAGALKARLGKVRRELRILSGLALVGLATPKDGEHACTVLEATRAPRKGPQDPSEPAQSAAGGGPVG